MNGDDARGMTQPSFKQEREVRPFTFRAVAFFLVLLAAAPHPAFVAADRADDVDLGKLPPAAIRPVDFVGDIQPLLRARCVSCHGAEEQAADLRLDIKRRAFEGSTSGTVIVPGVSASSRLIHLVAGAAGEENRMPPVGEGAPLSASDVALLRAWIDQGAAWPEEPETTARHTPDHWAFQPIRDPLPPRVQNDAWVHNPIDAFVLEGLEREAIEPSPEAPLETLLRRVSLDLTGLPPTPGEVEEFLADASEATGGHTQLAYQRLVDRLLASPHYGERWGRYWLDMARYADSDGYEKDRARPHAWRWREWVISSLNDDKPFDEFTIEQLAGDLLVDATTEQRTATGFHRNTLINTEGGVDREEDRVKRTVDRTNTLGEVWLGLTIGCAQCHSHKYDPVSQREYYSLYAFFNSLEEVDIPAPLPRHLDEHAVARIAYEKEQTAHLAAIAKHEGRNSLSVRAKEVLELLTLAERDRSSEQKSQLDSFVADADAQLVTLVTAAAQHARSAPKDPRDVIKAQTVSELAAPRTTQVHIRGDFLNRGVRVARSVPGVLPQLMRRGADREAEPGQPSSPNRLDLAEWLVDSQNPLTARVIVNRVWQQFFGRGLVASDNDFGTQGEEPSHPDLLDWLASELRRGGWSLKALHRLIVMSSTYRQASAMRPELAARDPLGTLLARQRRLRVEAEIVRDLTLAASNLLNRRLGGPSVFPPQPAGVAQLGFQNRVKWTTSSGGDRYRRGIYTFFQRTVPYPMFATFDAADSNTSCTRRERSNTPLQALTLWNDVVFFEAAQAFGRRIALHHREAGAKNQLGDPGARDQGAVERSLRSAFLMGLGRRPTDGEIALLSTYYLDQLTEFEADSSAAVAITRALPGTSTANRHERQRQDVAPDPELAAWITVARTLLNTDEFITRE